MSTIFAPMRSIVSSLIFLLWTSVALEGQLSILEAKAKPLGSVVTLSGTVTSGNEFGDLRYVQDITAGIATYPGENTRATMRQLVPGDSVTLTGVLIEYRGLLEISPVLTIERVGQGAMIPTAKIGSFGEVLSPEYHGSRVHVDCVVFESPGGVFRQGKYRLYDQSGSEAEIFLDEDHPLIGSTIPDYSFAITGISHYEFKEKFQVSGDGAFEPSNCLISALPEVKQIWTDGAAFEWSSSDAGYAQYRYGPHPDSLVTGIVLDSLSQHSASVSFIDPATVFYFQSGVTVGEKSAWAPVRPYISASESSGEVKIYFNNPVNEISELEPSGTTFSELMDAVFELISSAESTIDIAMYNINRDDIVNALEVAHTKGVRVRYIADADQGNNALDPLPDFPVMFRNGSGIMHNKFIIVDAEDPFKAQVWTGATNFTSNQLSRDPNNAISIRDQGLARVYTMEFEEMWGGDGEFPNITRSRTGEAKYDNTPHILNINGTMAEVYFSPSDYVSSFISGVISQASKTIDLGLLLITHEELAGDLVNARSGGVEIRGMYNDPEFSGGALNILENGGVMMYDYLPSSIFHHKYMIVDAGEGEEAILLTGSHNWTYSAENINDENTIVIHDNDISRLYRDEFESRLSETITSVAPVESRQIRVMPNPFSEYISVSADVAVSGLTLISADGTFIADSSDYSIVAGDVPPGVYFLEIRFSDRSRSYVKVVKGARL